MLIASLAVGNFLDIVNTKMLSDPELLLAIKELKAAETDLNISSNFSLPYLTLSGNMNANMEEVEALSTTPKISWNIWGMNVSISNELDALNWEWKGFSIKVSANPNESILYPEKIAKDRANLMLKQWKVISLKNSIVLDVFSDIFDWWIANSRKPLLQKKLEIFQKNLKEMKTKSFSEEELLKKEKEILLIKKEIANLNQSATKNFEESDFLEALEIAKKISNASCSSLALRKDLKAYELLKIAYEEEKKWLFLDDLPELSLNLNYVENPPPGMDNWSINLSFLWNVFDRGEKNMEKLNTTKTAEYYSLKSKKTSEDIQEELESLEQQMSSLELDLEIAKTERKISELEYDKTKKAYEAGKATLEDLTLQEIALSDCKMKELQITLNLLLLKMQYLSTCGIDLTELLEVGK